MYLATHTLLVAVVPNIISLVLTVVVLQPQTGLSNCYRQPKSNAIISALQKPNLNLFAVLYDYQTFMETAQDSLICASATDIHSFGMPH